MDIIPITKIAHTGIPPEAAGENMNPINLITDDKPNNNIGMAIDNASIIEAVNPTTPKSTGATPKFFAIIDSSILLLL